MVGPAVRLLGAADVRRIAAELDLRPTKQRGQNFVIDANTVRRIVRESGVGSDDVVVEVGPGLGSLTLALLDVADRVVAIEVDALLAARLPGTVAEYAGDRAARCEVVHGDALRIDGVPGPPPSALVANLPYNVSVPVLLHLLTVLPSLAKGLVMVQAEVADRLAAGPGSRTYGIPSVKAAWFAEVRRAGSVGRNVFWPAPNVDSGLVAWTRREPPPTTASREEVFAVVDAAFAQRRKTLRGALSVLAGSAQRSEEALRAAGVDPTARGEVLEVTAFARIAEALAEVPDMTVTVRAPAKINLHLGVGAPRADGFHPLVTVYQALGLCDDVTVTPSPGWTLSVSVPDWIDPETVPVTGDNIIDRAAQLLAGHHGMAARAAVSVTKAIPVAGGMAGGSADAAAALVALDRLWRLETPDADLLALAAELGSDVPFALLGGTALGTGRGELVEPVSDPTTWWWVVVPSARGLSTPAVYRRFDELSPDAPEEPVGADATLAALATGDPEVLAGALHNDLEGAALDLRPDLSDLLELGEGSGALRGMVSGSGPTCLFLAGDADSAREVAARLSEHHEVVLVANGPVAGAHVVTYA